jgi:hypothetical protein
MPTTSLWSYSAQDLAAYAIAAFIEDSPGSTQDKCREPDVPRRRLQLPVPSFTEFESGILRQLRVFRTANRDPGTGGSISARSQSPSRLCVVSGTRIWIGSPRQRRH